MKLHAVKSPSSSARWSICHASIQRESALLQARESNRAADMGTVMHDLGEGALTRGAEYIAYRAGKRAVVEPDGTVLYAPADSEFFKDGFIVDQELVDGASKYATFVEGLALGGDLHVEQRLSIEHITGEPGAKGTADAVICYPDELCVVDLKGGFKRVFASEELDEYSPVVFGRKPNTQLVMYAEAVRHQFESFYDFKQVRIIIVMPRLDVVDEHVMPMDEFAVWVEWLKAQAQACDGPSPRAVPGEKQCTYCKAFPCAEATALATSVALDDFDQPAAPPSDEFDLSRAKRLVPVVRMWADSIEREVHTRLSRGEPVPGWKLIDGDMGDRKWRDDAEARLSLHATGLTPEQYLVSKTISPAMTEALVRRSKRSEHKPLSPTAWADLQELITREEAAPKVVPESDPRPARTNPQEDFE